MALRSKRIRYLAKNTAIFAVGNMGTKLISFFLVPLYTNVLSTDQYGVADFVHTVCMVLAPVIVLNIGESIMRFALDKDADYGQIMSIGVVIFAGSMVVGLAIIPLAWCVETLSEYTIYIYLYTVSLAGSQILLCYLRGKERLVEYAVGSIIQTAGIAGLNIFYLLVLGQGLHGYFKAYIIASVITMLYAFFVGRVFSALRSFRFNLVLAREMIKYSVVLIPNTFMWWIISSSDRVLITALLGAAANGIYAVSYKIPSVVSVIASIFNQAWGYSAIHEDESEDRDSYSNTIYKGLVAVSVISGIALLLIMKPLMSVYVEASYYEAWRYTPFLIIGNVFMTTGTFLASWYTVNKDSKGYLFSATCGAVVNVVLNLVLIPYLGIAGSALATCVSYIAVFVYRAYDTQKYITIEVMNRRYVLAYAVLFLSGATLYIDGIAGELFILAEFVSAVVLFRDVWIPVLKKVAKRNGQKSVTR